MQSLLSLNLQIPQTLFLANLAQRLSYTHEAFTQDSSLAILILESSAKTIGYFRA